MERVKEFSELPREPPEFMEPRPPASWPASGEIKCEDLVIRYAVRPCHLYHSGNWTLTSSLRRLHSPGFPTSSTICRLRFVLVRKSAF